MRVENKGATFLSEGQKVAILTTEGKPVGEGTVGDIRGNYAYVDGTRYHVRGLNKKHYRFGSYSVFAMSMEDAVEYIPKGERPAGFKYPALGEALRKAEDKELLEHEERLAVAMGKADTGFYIKSQQNAYREFKAERKRRNIERNKPKAQRTYEEKVKSLTENVAREFRELEKRQRGGGK